MHCHDYVHLHLFKTTEAAKTPVPDIAAQRDTRSRFDHRQDDSGPMTGAVPFSIAFIALSDRL